VNSALVRGYIYRADRNAFIGVIDGDQLKNAIFKFGLLSLI
jgi:hypothetical protein